MLLTMRLSLISDSCRFVTRLWGCLMDSASRSVLTVLLTGTPCLNQLVSGPAITWVAIRQVLCQICTQGFFTFLCMCVCVRVCYRCLYVCSVFEYLYSAPSRYLLRSVLCAGLYDVKCCCYERIQSVC